MMQTAEQIIEEVRALPKMERRKLFELIEEEKIKENESKYNLEKEEKFKRALQWIDEHRKEFDGQWVVLDGDKLVSHGSNSKEVYDEARCKGIQTPFLKRIKAQVLPWGGW